MSGHKACVNQVKSVLSSSAKRAVVSTEAAIIATGMGLASPISKQKSAVQPHTSPSNPPLTQRVEAAAYLWMRGMRMHGQSRALTQVRPLGGS